MCSSVLEDVDVSVLNLFNLPVVRSFMNRLGIRDHIDALCPSRGNAGITHGQAVECLMANRLSAPRPLYDIENWASKYAVKEIIKVDPHYLNDDRIGRALDAIAPKVEMLQGNIVASAIAEFGLDARTVHWDLTSLYFCGEYPLEEQSKDDPIITYGYSSQHLSDKKQVRLGYGVTADGSVPIWQKVYNGNQSDSPTVIKTLRSLQDQVKLSDFLMIGDSKLLSESSILAYMESKLKFLAPLQSSPTLDSEFLAIPKEEFVRLSYVSGDQLRLPPEKRTTYDGCERTSIVSDPGARTSHLLRRVFIISSETRDARRNNRAKQMQKATAELDKLIRTAGSRHYPTVDDVKAKAAKIQKQRRVGQWYVTKVEERDGVPSFSYSLDKEALAATEELDGFYVLETSIPTEEADTTEILRRYKGEYRVEHRFRDSKQTLRIRPLFLSSNRRIAALVFIIGLALMVFALIEREARRNLPNSDDKIPDMLAGHVPARPTGQSIFQAFIGFHALVLTCNGERIVKLQKPNRLQATLLKLLGVTDMGLDTT